jgi:hypothetical protein
MLVSQLTRSLKGCHVRDDRRMRDEPAIESFDDRRIHIVAGTKVVCDNDQIVPLELRANRDDVILR